MTTIRRLVALATATMALAFMVQIATTSPADAATDDIESTFVMTVFPHDTTAVNFWDSWGARRSGGRSHRGIDIMAPRGSEVLAVADGEIADFGHSRLSGYFLTVDHGNGWTTTYMHLNNDTLGTDDGEGGTWTAIYPTLTVGADVIAGEVIGYVGDSGNAEDTQPHIHFEVKYDGTKINPYPYLTDVWKRQRRLVAGEISLI